jgi:hypothetical protein
MPLFIPEDSVKQSSSLCSWILEFSLSHHHHHLFFYVYFYHITYSPSLPPTTSSCALFWEPRRTYSIFYLCSFSLPLYFASASPSVSNIFLVSLTLSSHRISSNLRRNLYIILGLGFATSIFSLFAPKHHHHHHQLGDAESVVHICIRIRDMISVKLSPFFFVSFISCFCWNLVHAYPNACCSFPGPPYLSTPHTLLTTRCDRLVYNNSSEGNGQRNA